MAVARQAVTSLPVADLVVTGHQVDRLAAALQGVVLATAGKHPDPEANHKRKATRCPL